MPNKIHPTAIIDPHVSLGTDNEIGPFCVLSGRIRIGNGNKFVGHVAIGTAPEHRDYWNYFSHGPVYIGNRGVFREFTTVNAGTTSPTVLGDRVIMLRGAHVGHDCWVEDEVTLSCNAIVGGHSQILEGANIGLSAVIRQRLVVGAYAMLGMGAVVTKNCEPFMIYYGNPATNRGKNDRGIERMLKRNNKLPEQYLTQYAKACEMGEHP